MPLYEFYCPQCRKKFEELCRTSLDSVPCPRCAAAVSYTHLDVYKRQRHTQFTLTANVSCLCQTISVVHLWISEGNRVTVKVSCCN